MRAFRAASAVATIAVPLDSLVAVFHRPSGITHLLAEPAPQILAVLDDEPVAIDVLMARLAARFDVADADPASLAARLDELVEAGLVEAGLVEAGLVVAS